MNVSRTKIHLDTFISRTSISERREYYAREHTDAIRRPTLPTADVVWQWARAHTAAVVPHPACLAFSGLVAEDWVPAQRSVGPIHSVAGGHACSSDGCKSPSAMIGQLTD